MCWSYCAVSGPCMEVSWPGSVVRVMEVCGRGCWIVMGGGVMNGYVMLCVAHIIIMGLLIPKRRRLRQVLHCKLTLRVEKSIEKICRNAWSIGVRMYQNIRTPLDAKETFACELEDVTICVRNMTSFSPNALLTKGAMLHTFHFMHAITSIFLPHQEAASIRTR